MRCSKLRHGVPCRSFVLVFQTASAFSPGDRFALYLGLENYVEGLGRSRVNFSVFTDADLGEERMVGEATILV